MLAHLNSVQEAIYLNIPSSAYAYTPCRRRCYYCDFPVSVVGDGFGRNLWHYLSMLRCCVGKLPSPQRWENLKQFRQPSLLSVCQLTDIQKRSIGGLEYPGAKFQLKWIQARSTKSSSRLPCSWGESSQLGCSSCFSLNCCKFVGDHTVADIWAAVEMIRVGNKFQPDLISGPHQTLEQQKLFAVAAIAPTHISIYDLQIEAVTAFGRYYQPDVQPLPRRIQQYKCHR